MGLAKQGANETGSERGIAGTIHGAGPAGRAKARPGLLPANLSN